MMHVPLRSCRAIPPSRPVAGMPRSTLPSAATPHRQQWFGISGLRAQFANFSCICRFWYSENTFENARATNQCLKPHPVLNERVSSGGGVRTRRVARISTALPDSSPKEKTPSRTAQKSASKAAVAGSALWKQNGCQSSLRPRRQA